MGCPVASEFLISLQSAAAGVHSRSCCGPDEGVCDDRSESRTTRVSSAVSASHIIPVFTERAQEICHFRPTRWLTATLGENRRQREELPEGGTFTGARPLLAVGLPSQKCRQAVQGKKWVRRNIMACGCIWPVDIMTPILKGFVVVTIIQCPEFSSAKCTFQFLLGHGKLFSRIHSPCLLLQYKPLLLTEIPCQTFHVTSLCKASVGKGAGGRRGTQPLPVVV